jgi:Zn finger protein HypA/HybF involved in hydrogenase expression
MDEYTTVECSTCNQAIYIARYRLEGPSWLCPACRSANETVEVKQPTWVTPSQSRFARLTRNSA